MKKSNGNGSGNQKYGMIVLGVLVLASLGLSLYNFTAIQGPAQNRITAAVTAAQLLSQVTALPEMEQYRNINPLNIIQITQENLPQLQTQIEGLTQNYIGKFIIEYPNIIIIYDFENNRIDARIQTPKDQAVAVILQRLSQHEELGDLRQIDPGIAVIDKDSLAGLQRQYPSYFSDAAIGQLLLRYPQHLVVYDAQADAIQKILTISEQSP